MHPRTIHLHECERDKEVFVSLRPHLPIRGRPFKFEILYNGSKHQDVVGKICIRGEKIQQRCVGELTDRYSFYRPSWIRITAICPRTDSARTTSEVDVNFHNDGFNDGQSNLFWSSYKFLPIKVIKIDIEMTFYGMSKK